MRFGICCAPTALGDPARSLELLWEAGADYIEWGVWHAMEDETTFEKLRAVVANSPLRSEAFNGFIPAKHRITGPDVDLQSALDYASEAMRRCSALGAQIVVLGSGGARRLKDGWEPTRGLNQFETFCRELGPRAAEHNITVVIEPLNKSDAVDHPNIKLLADFYHMFHDDEATNDVAKVGDRLRHTHLADLGRVAPGFAAEGEADFLGFFRALNAANYDARCSFEGKTTDFAAQVGPIIAHMKQRHNEAVKALN